jgi:hypothetical protein
MAAALIVIVGITLTLSTLVAVVSERLCLKRSEHLRPRNYAGL